MRQQHRRLVLCALAGALAACGHNPAAPNDGTAIVFNFETPEVVIGDTLQLTAKVNDATGSPIPNVTFTWKSLDTSIATVSADGLVTAVKMGDTSIQVDATIPEVAQSHSSIKWLASIWTIFERPVHAAGPRHVTKSLPTHSVPKVVITPASVTLGTGVTQQYTVIATDNAGKPLVLLPTTKWSSSNAGVATIGQSSGLATTKAKGSAVITATVDTSTAWFAKGTANLSVSDQCEGIAAVTSITGKLDYRYERDGTLGTAKIHSKFNASNLSATLNKAFALTDPGIAQWKGRITGSASQAETKDYPDGPHHTLSAGAISDAEMVVTVDLNTCKYQVTATVIYPVTRTDQEGGHGGVDIEKKPYPLSPKSGPGSFFADNEVFEPYRAVTDAFAAGDVFVVSGFAAEIEGDLGNAEVTLTLSAAGANDRLLARKAPPPSMFALIGKPLFKVMR